MTKVVGSGFGAFASLKTALFIQTSTREAGPFYFWVSLSFMVCTLLSHKILLSVLDVDSAVLGLKNPAALTNSLKAMLFLRSLTAYRD